MIQKFSSAGTSINSTKLPAVYRKAKLTAKYVLDYGCGRYTDHIRESLPGRVYLPYDPFNQPYEVNEATRLAMGRAEYDGTPVDVICSNVLNVINDDWTVGAIARYIEHVTETTGGTAYITVYEGDRSGIGRQTGPDQYQRNEPLRNYLRFFRNATVRSGMIVIAPAKSC